MTYESSETKSVVEYIRDSYDVEPEFLWAKSENAAFRHKADKKWFGALLLRTPRKRLGLDQEGRVDILDVKCDPIMIPSLIDGQGILPGYHMNKEHWMTVLLDGTVPMEKIIWLIDASYNLTLKKVKKSTDEKDGGKK